MAVPRRSLAALADIVARAPAHRSALLRAGFTPAQLRALAHAHGFTVFRRTWFVAERAPAALREAAARGGRVTCTSLARHRGWWVPASVGDEPHLHFPPGSTGPRVGPDWRGVTHWTRPLVPLGASLEGSVEDALAHIAACVPHDDALVLWESAARVEGIAPEAIRGIRFASPTARALAEEVTGLADSGLEVLVALPLRRAGLVVRQQVVLAGRPVDILVGARLVVQIDGYEFHAAGSAQRSRDMAHDAELRLRGYTVLRFSYEHVVHRWPEVERTIRRAVAAGLDAA